MTFWSCVYISENVLILRKRLKMLLIHTRHSKYYVLYSYFAYLYILLAFKPTIKIYCTIQFEICILKLLYILLVINRGKSRSRVSSWDSTVSHTQAVLICVFLCCSVQITDLEHETAFCHTISFCSNHQLKGSTKGSFTTCEL